MIWALCLKTPYSYTSPYFPIQLYIRSILVKSEYKFFVIVDPTYYFWHTFHVSKYTTLMLLQSCYYKTIVCIVFIEILSRSPFLKIWSEGHPPPRYIYTIYAPLKTCKTSNPERLTSVVNIFWLIDGLITIKAVIAMAPNSQSYHWIAPVFYLEFYYKSSIIEDWNWRLSKSKMLVTIF